MGAVKYLKKEKHLLCSGNLKEQDRYEENYNKIFKKRGNPSLKRRAKKE